MGRRRHRPENRRQSRRVDPAVLDGDCTRLPELLDANELSSPPDAFVVTRTDDTTVEDVLGTCRSLYDDGAPVYVGAKSLRQQREYLKQGTRALHPESFEKSLQLGQSVLDGFQTKHGASDIL